MRNRISLKRSLRGRYAKKTHQIKRFPRAVDDFKAKALFFAHFRKSLYNPIPTLYIRVKGTFMGFKRTSEGRVYFQGADEPAPAAKPIDYRVLKQNNAAPAKAAPTSAPSGQATQFQILTLLKVLNDKLQSSQTERAQMRIELDAYKKVIEDLGGKTMRGEKAWQNLEQKMSQVDKAGAGTRAEKIAADALKELQETRKLILELEDKAEKADKGVSNLQRQIGHTVALGDALVKKQESYEELLKRLDENDQRQEDLSKKVEETVTVQSKMLRQIEKVAEDRTRFMRKIERIEETVIQTRDALSAKAMVLLTEQGAGARIGAGAALDAGLSVPEQLRSSAPRQSATWIETIKERPALQAACAVGVLAFGVLAGWGINAALQARQASLNSFPNAPISEQTSLATPPDAAQTPSSIDANINENKNTEAPTSDEVSGPYAPPQSDSNLKSDDIGTVDVNDPKKLADMLDKSPDATAAVLNKIEPGDQAVAAPPPAPEKIASAKPIPKAELPKAGITQSNAPELPVAATEKPASKEELEKLMRPDSSLPAAAKNIETQAYGGIKEAQHDLAAIYTAGQGGVKQDYARAAFWFHQAANQGVGNAAYNLGVLYHQGLGVKPDMKEAIKWYQQAAALGHPEAEYNLGIAYIEGVGVAYDPVKAADNFERAAKQNITEAAYNLGLIYENGLLGKPEPDQALKWYKTAADAGSPEAKEALTELAKNLKINVEDVNRVADGVKTQERHSEAAPAKAEPQSFAGDNRALTAQVQEYLMKAGLYPGPADGSQNAITSDAIRSYQSANNMPADGRVSQELLAHMLADDKN